MQLGALIERLEHDDTAGQALEALGDIVLYTRVCAMAQAFGESPGAYVAVSVSRFAATADDEAWLGLVAAMERAEAPGDAALVRMLEWALRDDAAPQRERGGRACGCGNDGSSCHDTA